MRIHPASVLLASLILFPAIPAAADCLGTNELAAARSFYRQHADFYYADPTGFKELVTPALFKVLAMNYACAQGQECALDSDPWMDAQDGEITDPITYSLGDHDAAQATVTMHYVFTLSESQKSPRQVQLKMQLPAGQQCWRVDDLVTPRGGSLTKAIADWFVKYGADAAPTGGTNNP